MPRRLVRGDRLVIATHNPGKLTELRDLLAPHGLAVTSAGELGLPEPEETAADFAGNARLKALAAAQGAGLPALADDSGFCVAALRGAPGVVSARWAGPGKDFGAAMRRVRQEMGDTDDRRAWFTCALCLAWPDGGTATFLGRAEGQVAWPPRGTRGFGYDPMFLPRAGQGPGQDHGQDQGQDHAQDRGTQTYGEMAPAEKHATSHRARAIVQLTRACLP